jgi:hypothetical protein
LAECNLIGIYDPKMSKSKITYRACCCANIQWIAGSDEHDPELGMDGSAQISILAASAGGRKSHLASARGGWAQVFLRRSRFKTVSSGGATLLW